MCWSTTAWTGKGPSLSRALRYLDRQRPTVLVLQWWTGAVLHTYLRLARYAAQRGARVILEWRENQDVGEAALPGTSRYVRTLMPRLLSLVDAHVVHSSVDLPAITESHSLGDTPVHVMLASDDRYGLGLVAAGQRAAGQDQIQSATHAAT